FSVVQLISSLLSTQDEYQQKEDQEVEGSCLPRTWTYRAVTYFVIISGKHRKHPGGRGNAGGAHHHRINMDKYHPGYFGKLGMRNYHLRRNTKWCPTINLDKLWSLVSEQTKAKAQKTTEKAPVIDVVRAGYYKVLGKGNLPKQPVIVKAKFFSKSAEDKIRAAGGACILQA
ncbi:60S ribosomal protein L27a, partial [Frankliniella fusca]